LVHPYALYKKRLTSDLAQTDKGLTVFLVPRGPGVETRPIKTAYSATAGTAYVTFDNVRVPAENMLGKENDGIRVICEFQG
jgi:alkylation response protein AidB-like acyl-CoA dehydrogenase